jgi:hypothetical protein
MQSLCQYGYFAGCHLFVDTDSLLLAALYSILCDTNGNRDSCVGRHEQDLKEQGPEMGRTKGIASVLAGSKG